MKHEGEADAAQDEGHPEPEGHDEDQAVGRSIHVDRGEQDDQGIRRRDQAAGQPEHEQAAPADRGRRRRVLRAFVGSGRDVAAGLVPVGMNVPASGA